jgi:hypothetical protein
MERGEAVERRVEALADEVRTLRSEMSSGFLDIMGALGKPNSPSPTTPTTPAFRSSKWILPATEQCPAETSLQVFELARVTTPYRCSFSALFGAKNPLVGITPVEWHRFTGSFWGSKVLVANSFSVGLHAFR